MTSTRLFGAKTIFGVSIVLAASGCSWTLDADRKQCVTDSDCSVRGAPFSSSVCVDNWCAAEPKWGCLDAPEIIFPNPGPYPVTLRVEDVLTQQALEGVSARLCRKLDVACTNPLGPDLLTDKDGIVRFDVVPDDPRTGFTGYVMFNKAGLMTGLYFFNPAVDGPLHIGAVQMVSPTVANLLTLQVGSAYDPNHGLILLNTLDCAEQSTAGVTLEADARDALTLRFYAVDGLPTANATATDMDGWGGMINVPAGTTSVTGRLLDSGRLVGRVSLFIKPNTISYSRVVPLGT